MLTFEEIAPDEDALAEAKAYLRVESDGEDALIAGFMATAAGLCERFTGTMLLARAMSETLGASSGWRRLGATPVTAIIGAEGLPATGVAIPLSVSDYAADIDANGDGWVRLLATGTAERFRVAYRAGASEDWQALPEALRQGILRLTAHFYTHREGAASEAPPAAVSALWRPWRRMRLGAARRVR